MDHQTFAQLLGNYGEFVGAIAVVATLAYLAIQIRQNSASVKSAAAQSVLSNVNANLQTVAETPQMARVIHKGLSDYGVLTEEERFQFISWILAWFRVVEQAHYFYSRGDLDAHLFDGHRAHLRVVFEAESVRTWWGYRADYFSNEFQEFVTELRSAPTTTLAPPEIVNRMAGWVNPSP